MPPAHRAAAALAIALAGCARAVSPNDPDAARGADATDAACRTLPPPELDDAGTNPVYPELCGPRGQQLCVAWAQARAPGGTAMCVTVAGVASCVPADNCGGSPGRPLCTCFNAGRYCGPDEVCILQTRECVPAACR